MVPRDWRKVQFTRQHVNCIANGLAGASIMAAKSRLRSDHITCKHCGRDFGAITFRHLRNIHGYDGDHPINEYKHKFRLQSAMCGEARNKVSEAKEAFWAKRGQHWTGRTLIAEIQRLHRAGSLPCKRVPVRVYMAGRRLFGSWQAAVEKAGLDYEEATGVRNWTPAKVVESIKELAKRGVPLSATYIRDHHPTLLNVATKRFPRSWAKALKAAGLDPAEHKLPRGRWNRQRAAEWVRKRAAKKRSLLARGAPRDLLGFVHRRLKTNWPDFVESLGFTYPGIKKRRDWTRQKLLEEIRRRKSGGHRLNYRAVQSEYQALIHQARKYFRSWDRARAAAGV